MSGDLLRGLAEEIRALHQVDQFAVLEEGGLGAGGRGALEIRPGLGGGFLLHAGEDGHELVKRQAVVPEGLEDTRPRPRCRAAAHAIDHQQGGAGLPQGLVHLARSHELAEALLHQFLAHGRDHQFWIIRHSLNLLN